MSKSSLANGSRQTSAELRPPAGKLIQVSTIFPNPISIQQPNVISSGSSASKRTCSQPFSPVLRSAAKQRRALAIGGQYAFVEARQKFGRRILALLLPSAIELAQLGVRRRVPLDLGRYFLEGVVGEAE